MTAPVTCEVADGIADVRLTRPEKRNALDGASFIALVAIGTELAADPSIRAVVLSGDGPTFCAGLDMSLFGAMADTNRSAESVANVLRDNAQRSVRLWGELAAPVIVAVHGAAVGGGLQLALGADIRIVAPDAQMGALEIQWGIVPDMCGTQLLPALVGPDVAKDLIFTGRLVRGDEALRIGLATRLSDDPRRDALALAREIAARNPDAIQVGKRLVDLAWADTLDARLATEQEWTYGLVGSENQLAAVRANLEARGR